MLNRIHLENFKANRDVDVRLASLTVLAGLNSSGKSTLLQAIGLLRQSYGRDGSTSGLALSGPFVQIGKFIDLLSEGTTDDFVRITLTQDGQTYRWAVGGALDSSQIHFREWPDSLPSFIRSTKFQFLQANRIAPQTLYPQGTQEARETGFLGARGEYTIDFLGLSGDQKVSGGRTFPTTGIELDANLLAKVSATEKLLDQVSGWLQQLSPGARLRTQLIPGTDEVLLQYQYERVSRDVSSNFYRPTNVGFGLTYSLPIIVACLAAPPGALLLLENPEAHLHPQGQAALGELISKVANDGVQIIVETHSDHLLNGIRRSVKKEFIQAQEVAMHFFSRSPDNGESFVQSPVLLANGRVSNWPRGFFDQWDKDIEAILSES